jgi:hypothetical protein
VALLTHTTQENAIMADAIATRPAPAAPTKTDIPHRHVIAQFELRYHADPQAIEMPAAAQVIFADHGVSGPRIFARCNPDIMKIMRTFQFFENNEQLPGNDHRYITTLSPNGRPLHLFEKRPA